MDRRQLQVISRETLRQLGLRPPLDVHLLSRRLGDYRGRPIEVIPTTKLPPNSAFGITGGDEHRDVIMYEAQTTKTHQLLIIFHELAHIVLEHPRRAVDHSYNHAYPKEIQTVWPDVHAASRRRWWARRKRNRTPYQPPQSVYDDPIEWEAETMATILLSWVDRYGDSGARASDPLESTLGDVPAW